MRWPKCARCSAMRRAGADLLIEHLHLIQDRYRCLSTRHLAALAQELRLAQAEVYEVASFYHHFDVVREGDAAPAALTVRVCDGIACELAGAADLLAAPAGHPRRRRARAPRALRRPLRAGPGGSRRPESHPASHRRDRAADGRRRHRHRYPRSRLPRPGRLRRRGRLRAAAPVRRRRNRRRGRDRRHGDRPACAAWAAPASRPGASGASCAASPARA